MQRARNRLAGLLALFFWSLASTAVAAIQPKPYHLLYETTQGPKGTSVRTLKRDNAQWLMGTDSRAKIAFLKVRHLIETRFSLSNDTINTLSQQTTTKAITTKRSGFTVDSQANSVTWRYKKKTGQTPSDGPVIDDSTLQLAIADKLNSSAQQFTFKLFRKRGFVEQTYRVIGPEVIDTRLGPIDTIAVERVREDSNKQTIMFYAPQLDYTLVRIDQLDDGEGVVIVLKSGDIDGTPVGELLANRSGQQNNGDQSR